MTDVFFVTAAVCFYLCSIPFYGALLLKENAQRAGRWAGWILTAAFLSHTAALVGRAIAAGHAPLSNLYESLVFYAWAVILVFLFFDWKYKTRKLGLFSVLLNLGLLIYALSLDPALKPLAPALQSSWLMVHVTCSFLSYGAFAVSFAASLVYLTPLRKKFSRPEMLEEWIYKLILFGFPLLTLGVGAGALWAHQAWGVYWNWDPKETWALITWFVYALYLHLRLLKSCSSRNLVKVAFFGFLCVMFTYLGVGLLLPGLHGYVK